jgi:hypothetical protein
MLFTRLGYVVAVIALVLGTINFTMGMLIATGVIGPYEAALANFYPTKSTSGEVINMGMYLALFGIALGYPDGNSLRPSSAAIDVGGHLPLH